MAETIMRTVSCNFCRCGNIIPEGKMCPDWVDVTAWGAPSGDAREIVKRCKAWMQAHQRDLHGALYDFRGERVYFFPIHAVVRCDFDLEESLCDLDLDIARDEKVKTKFEAMLAIAGDMEETRRFADFVINDDD